MAEIQIVEQPASKGTRFRYECEGRSAGSIPGVSSTKTKKTFPAIRVVGIPPRKAVVVVSCVTADPPYRPHPHNLVGRDGCKRGICSLEIPPDKMFLSFPNLGIQCVKKKGIEASLNLRKELRVDPFQTGFSAHGIDLNSVRLCFQVYLESEKQPGRFCVPLPPKLSNPIYDKKIKSELTITKLSDCVSNVDGGQKDIIMLCDKITKEDIQVRFFEEVDDNVVWEDFAQISPGQVHKQHALWFKTPPYKNRDIRDPVKVFIQLRRPSDGATSEALPFQYIPSFKSKKKRPLDIDYSDLNLVDAPRYQQYLNENNPGVANVNYPTIHNYPNQSPHYNILSPAESPSTHPFHYNLPYSNQLPWAEPSSSTPQQSYYTQAVPPAPAPAPPHSQPQVAQARNCYVPQNSPFPDLDNLSLSDIVPEINNVNNYNNF